jgi:hypothetical protein
VTQQEEVYFSSHNAEAAFAPTAIQMVTNGAGVEDQDAVSRYGNLRYASVLSDGLLEDGGARISLRVSFAASGRCRDAIAHVLADRRGDD